METNRIKLSSIVETQLPLFVREDYPLVSELLTEYYRSLELKGSSYDILQNIDQYVKVNNLSNLVEKTKLKSDIGFVDTTISVDSTDGFPQTYGIIQINNEIVLYKSKTSNTFNECTRGFSGISEYSTGNSEDFIFSSTEIQEHSANSEIINLSSLFLKEFFQKIKKQFAHGFDNRSLFSGINQNLFIKQSKDFYTSKGTDRSFEILFRVLYGKDVEVILPKKYLIQPSNAQYRVTRNFVVEQLQGNIEELVNRTVFQDQYGSISKSFGTVTDIQRIFKNGREYHILMLDYDFDKDIIVSGSIFGELKIHPKTVTTTATQVSSDNIVVDSTIGFPDSGELVVNGEFAPIIITYSEKTINQFLGCSGVIELIASNTDIALNTYAYGFDSDGNQIQFRITGVIQDIELPFESKYYEQGDIAKLLTLGYNEDYFQDNNWIFNKTVKCEVKSFSIFEQIGNSYSYEIETYDDNGIYDGDRVEIEYLDDSGKKVETPEASLETGSIPGKKFLIRDINSQITRILSIKKIQSRYEGKYISDVLNVYRDFNSDSIYVASSSLPSYKNGENTIKTIEDFKIVFGGTFSGTTIDLGKKHGFLTGDSVIYSYENSDNTLGIQSGVYFVKNESKTSIKLARSRSDIRFEKFVSIGTTTVSNNIISLTKFAKSNNVPSEIDSQRLIKLLRAPENTGVSYPTKSGTTGILLNGVEILNYKSDDYLYYGEIKTADVISPGTNYDIINPPELQILPESVGLSSAFGYCGVEGSLQKIDLIDGGFDYIDTPVVNITGGNGSGASALVKTTTFDHSAEFNATTSNSKINLASNIIGFSTYHKFRNGESVVYNNGNSTPIGGLTTDAKYYVKVIDGYTINLHKTLNDSLSGINTVDLTAYGTGNHRFESIIPKKKISSIVVTNPGSGYKSKKISVPTSGINTSINTVNVYENPYNSGDIIYYYGGDTNISGLDTGKYIATRIDNTSFKLSAIGIGSTASDFYYSTKQYIDFKSSGSGNHIFDYEPITVTISGKVGTSVDIITVGTATTNVNIGSNSISVNTVGLDVIVGDTYINSGNKINVVSVGSAIAEATTNAGIGTDIISVIAPAGTLVGDFIQNGNENISIISIGTTDILLSSTISSGINTGDSIKFIGNNLIGLGSTISVGINTNDIFSFNRSIDISAKIQPVFRGKVVSTFIYDGGVGYGSSEIINYNKQPGYRLKSGYGAVISPIVSNGRLVNVVINEKGNEYNSIPDLIVRGFGVGAKLTPIVRGGQIVDVKIITSGIGYEQKNTTIDVVAAGSGCELKFNPQVWTINDVERRLLKTEKISSNDSVVFVGNNQNYGLQYTHLYPPRPLRKKVFSRNLDDGIVKYRSDYDNDKAIEKYHSPLLGWAYDGNPIYGPYGYDSPTNKKIRQMTSGYVANDSAANRPDKKTFPKGYFVEDYVFQNFGDLDEHNGRFCVTPEFPNGTYAYFMTLELVESGSIVFAGDKAPKFPYIIGNSYKSKPIEFNFNSTINQNNFNFQDLNLVRNTNPFNTLDKNSVYEQFKFSDNLNSEVKNITRSGIESIKIISGGQNYKVGDRVVFNNQGTNGASAAAEVDFISGKTITGISQTSILIPDIEFYPSSVQNRIIGFSSIPHNFSVGDSIFIDSLSNYDGVLNGRFNVGVRSDSFVLISDIGNTSSTGIVTYFNVSGILKHPTIRENDILTIGSEQVKVLNIDESSSRIRVLREQNSTVGTSHSAYDVLYQNPRNFYIELNDSVQNKNYKLNKELYFNPSESLGIGTIVGIGYTITFSNPGVGITNITIPEKTIYIKDHGLDTGDELIYKVNSGIGITVTDNSTPEFALENNSLVYVAKVSKDLIGISTIKVGLGTTGEFVGISQTASTLYFTSPGSGTYHSFSTKFDSISKGNAIKNEITVSTASTHSLKKGDDVILEVSSGLTTTIIIKYSDYHRRLIVNPKDFTFVDLNQNLITIQNHNYENGQKLIHTSTSSAVGLEDQGIYYAIKYDRNRIRLAKSYYDAENHTPIKILSSSFGTLSQINPKISITKNQKVIIDVSDNSLSQPSSSAGIDTSAFDFELFSDKNFSSKYFPVNSDGIAKIARSGVIGVSPDAKVEFTLDDEFLPSIWYNLIPKTEKEVKNQYTIDDEVIENNKITFVTSVLNGQKSIVGVSSSTFTFNNEFDFDTDSYTTQNGSFNYYTNSKNETGRIESIKVTSSGRNYKSLPFISSINSSTGSGGLLIPQSSTIGKVNSSNVTDIGYDYSIDNTIRPKAKFPTILRVEPLSTVDSIQVISPGLNYNTSPDLVVIDGFTNKVVNDISLNYDFEEKSVTIIKNTRGLYNVEPKIIAVNNSNGLGISSVQYNNSTKTVKAYLTRQFSDLSNFPFNIGDNVLIENISINVGTGVGYNSKNYDYSLFPVVDVEPSLGGPGAYVEYSLEDYLSDTESPGTFNSENSSGQIIPEEFLPVFETRLSKNSYIVGESVTNENNETGKVLKFDKQNEFLIVETKNNFTNGILIIGQTSKSQAFIKEVFENESFYIIGSSSIVESGWNRQTGFLNNDLQRVQDSDYYQNFSYSIKSEVPIQEWNDVVSNLNHTLGFKKFGELEVNSVPEISGIQTSQNDGFFSAVCDLNNTVDVDCIQDYDLVSENSLYVDNTLTSDEIIFNSVILQDYSESIGNKVLVIDDISDEFNTSVTRTFVTSFNI